MGEGARRMTNKEVEKIRKSYMNMVTSPKFSYPPVTQTQAMLSWLEISVAIESSGVVNESDD
tara:strand:- start:124 stop:309 length:186 start_codon:yes stop_codon:yes gene_type:complete